MDLPRGDFQVEPVERPGVPEGLHETGDGNGGGIHAANGTTAHPGEGPMPAALQQRPHGLPAPFRNATEGVPAP
jgi:hypothetical protein